MLASSVVCFSLLSAERYPGHFITGLSERELIQESSYADEHPQPVYAIGSLCSTTAVDGKGSYYYTR